MPFSAINTYEQELKQRNERHTLELQLEQAMQVYQKALEAQGRGDRDQADEFYTKLFAFDVLKPKKISEKTGNHHGSESTDHNSGHHHHHHHSGVSGRSLQLGPAIRLRAMALKNFALLLISDGDSVSAEDVDRAFQCLSEALDLVGVNDDEKLVLPSLVPISWAIGFRRLARLGLEVLVQNGNGSATVPLEEWLKDRETTYDLFGPRTIESLKALDYAVQQIENPSGDGAPPPTALQKYEYLNSLREEQPSLIETLDSNSKIQVYPASKSWASLITSINEALGTASRRGKRKAYKDNYAWSQRDLWNVEFSGTALQRHEAKDRNSEPPTAALPRIEVKQQDPPEDTESPAAAPSTPPAQTVQEDGPPSRERYGDTENDGDADPEGDQEGGDQDDGNSNREASHSAVSSPAPAAATEGPSSALQPALVASPVKRRRIDRVKRSSSSLALPADFGIVDSNYAVQFNAYLALTESPLIPKFYSPANLFLDPTQDIPPALVGAAKLRAILSGWDARESSQFLMEATSTKPQKGGIIVTLRKGNVSHSEIADSDSDDDESRGEDIILESQAVDQFLIAHNNTHIQQIRWHLARVVLAKLASGNQSKSFGKMTFTLVDEIESLLWAHREHLSADETLAIFALYADNWIRNKKTDDLAVKVCRWQGMSALQPLLPHSWISAFLYQESNDADPEASVSQFEGILEFVEANTTEMMRENLRVLLTYLVDIPPLTTANLQMQISKFKAAAAFERVLTPASARTTDEKAEDMRLLEAMLMPEKHQKPASTSDAEYEAILNFLGYAQPQFKMGLWYILLEKYEANGNSPGSLLGLAKIFSEAISSMDKGEPLLQVLSVAHDVGIRLAPLLERNPNLLMQTWSKDDASAILVQIVKLLQTLQLFMLYDDAVNSNLLQKPITPSWPKALAKFRELVVLWWSIFYRFWVCCIPEQIYNHQETINDFLSIIHERLGNLGYCGLANQCLLNLHLSEIVRINWDGSALDMCQCLKCQYGFTVSLYGDTANHHTQPTELTEKDAKMLLPYVMHIIVSHRSFNQAVMRMDTRTLIDAFAKAYGKPDAGDKQALRKEEIANYFERDFSPSLLRRAWNGKDDTRLSGKIGDDACGIWLIQAYVQMSQYKMRRRQAYSAPSVRTESLETAIDLFMEDVAARPARLESWVGLAQAYLYMCEDCLTFGDELAIDNIPETYCRKALLAVTRAIAIEVSEKQQGFQQLGSTADSTGSEDAVVAPASPSFGQKEIYESAKLNVWSLLGYSLMLAVLPPLLRKPFIITKRPSQPVLVELPTSKTIRIGIITPNELDSRTALSVALRCLSKESDSFPRWIGYMYQTMAAQDIELEPSQVLYFAEKANELSPSGVYDAEVQIISLLWDFYWEKKMPHETIKQELAKLNCGGKDEPTEIVPMIQSKLRWLIHKSKWLHRPYYILARIEEVEMKNTKTAQQELMNLFSLKSPTKPLVIWKTDSDLPGQHGVYMTNYIRYMVDLMLVNEDSAGLITMARRFRKTGAEMWNHAVTYEYIYGKTCELVHRLLPVTTQSNSKYSEVLMSEVSDNGDAFDIALKLMISDLENNYNENDKWTQALYYVSELRRLHSGPGTIAQADELMIVIFLTIFKQFSGSHDAQIQSQIKENQAAAEAKANEHRDSSAQSDRKSTEGKSSKKSEKQSARKKLIRKDIIHAAQQYLKPVLQQLSKSDDMSMPKDLATI